MTFLISDIAIYADDTSLFPDCDQASNLWQQLELASESETDLRNTMDWGKKWLVDFNAGIDFRLTDLITLVLLMWKWVDFSLRKNHLLRCYGSLSLLNLDWGFYIISIAKLPPSKLNP